MRADRLISLLMLLQRRGRMTAEELAAELEVSVRTIYRDLDALSASGIPVVAERGVGGGCGLLEEYRANLAALTEDEARSLFLLSVPEPLAALGLAPTLKTAYHKLSAALPGLRQEAALARPRIHLDWTPWRKARSEPQLQAVYRAIQEGRRLHIGYRLANLIPVEQAVDPCGLVAKAGAWYLVFSSAGKLNWRRVASLETVEVLEQPCRLPEDFDLAAFWSGVCARVEQENLAYRVRLRVQPPALPALRDQARALAPGPEPGEDGWQTCELYFESLPEARRCVLSLGGAVEVLEPEPLRRSVADFAAQTASLYAQKASVSHN
jgi:predicted DNA-binding transcriptional regulator YafY